MVEVAEVAVVVVELRSEKERPSSFWEEIDLHIHFRILSFSLSVLCFLKKIRVSFSFYFLIFPQTFLSSRLLSISNIIYTYIYIYR